MSNNLYISSQYQQIHKRLKLSDPSLSFSDPSLNNNNNNNNNSNIIKPINNIPIKGVILYNNNSNNSNNLNNNILSRNQLNGNGNIKTGSRKFTSGIGENNYLLNLTNRNNPNILNGLLGIC